MPDSFTKKENIKKRDKKKKDKNKKKEERKLTNNKGKGFDSMIIYVDKYLHSFYLKEQLLERQLARSTHNSLTKA